MNQLAESLNPISTSIEKVKACINNDEAGILTLSQLGEDVKSGKFCQSVCWATKHFFASDNFRDPNTVSKIASVYFEKTDEPCFSQDPDKLQTQFEDILKLYCLFLCDQMRKEKVKYIARSVCELDMLKDSSKSSSALTFTRNILKHTEYFETLREQLELYVIEMIQSGDYMKMARTKNPSSVVLMVIEDFRDKICSLDVVY